MSAANSVHDALLAKFAKSAAVPASGDSPPVDAPTDVKVAKLDSDIPLKDLKFVRFLNIAPKVKRIYMECEYNGEPAVVVFEKMPFDEDVTKLIAAKFSDSLCNVENVFRNDIYGTYLASIVLANAEKAQNSLNQISIQIIHPARPRDIEKYLDHPYYLVRETAELYQQVTKPFIMAQVNTPGHLQWLYNVLEHKAETDRIVYENLDAKNGFILAKDMKWKFAKEGELTDAEKHELYLNALIMRRDVHTLRDLTSEHLPLLEAIYSQGRKAIADKYSVDPQVLRVFIHYQPSFFHLHVHFTHIKAEPQGGFQSERAHMLSSVMENIRLVPDYYQRVALEFPLSSISELKREQFN